MRRPRLTYQQDGKKWIWWVANGTYNGVDNSGGYLHRYMTNDHGEGIFSVTPWERKQLVGTCQFSVAGYADPKRRIREWMFPEAYRQEWEREV